MSQRVIFSTVIKHPHLECSTCTMFLSSSFTVSIIALFLSSSLSETYIKAPFILFLSFVISCILSTKRLLKRFLLIYPLSPTYLPKRYSRYSKGFLPSTSPGVIINLKTEPRGWLLLAGIIQNGYRKPLLEKNNACICIPVPHKSVSDNGNLNCERI